MKVDTERLEQLLAQAEAALSAQKWDEAVGLAQQAATLSPRDGRPWTLTGYAHQGAGREKEAAEALQRSVSLDDHDLDAALALARLYWRAGKADEAFALANFILLREQEQPALRRQAQDLKELIANTGRKP